MLKPSRFVLPATLLLLTFNVSLSARTHVSFMAGVLRFPSHSAAIPDTDRDRDGLNGPVRRIKTETAKLLPKSGQLVEGPRQVLETASYDMKGAKIDYAFFPTATDSLTGKEVYKYDDNGNIAEMTLLNTDGSVLSKETYQYEFDKLGNWTKMTTLVAVVENGQMTFEPKEMTYRSITYYLEDSVAKVMQPGGNSATAAASAAATTPAVTKPSITPVKMEVANATPPSPVAGTATPNNAPASNAASNTTTKNPAANNTAAPATNKAAKPAAATPAPASAMITATSAAPLSTNTATASNLTLKATEPLPPPANQNTDAPAKAETEAPAKPLRGVPVKPISGGVLNGKALELPKPDYPEIARRARASGLVSVEVVIDLNGKVIAAKAVSGPSMLQRAAEQAALRARFTPTLLSGQPVKMTGTINYNFSF